MKYITFLITLVFASVASAASFTWDATKDGRLMTATNDIVLFKNVALANCKLTGCWFNKAGRHRVDGSRAMCNGCGIVCHEQRTAEGQTLIAQCQLCTEGYTKCVKIQLRQAGADVMGRVLYAKYCPKAGANHLGVDFDTFKPVAQQEIYSVLPSGRATNGYNVDQLTLREIGAAADNIPDPTDGSMPEDTVLDFMETPVEPEIWKTYCAQHPAPFHLFGEDRHYAVRNNIIPAHWFAKDNHAATIFRGHAQPGEFYPFQICVASETARTLRWRAETDLPVTCVTPETCAVSAKGVKPIWVMLDIPATAQQGQTLRGRILVTDTASNETRTLPFEIAVTGALLKDGGVSDAWRLARLKWLTSTLGDEDTVTRPYTPVTIDSTKPRTIRLLGRTLTLAPDGLPAQITSSYSGSNTKILDTSFNLLARPFSFTAEGEEFGPAGESTFTFTSQKQTEVAWRAETRYGSVKRIVEGKMDFTGTGFFRIRFEGGSVRKAVFGIDMPAQVARYFEGLGRNGGAFPDNLTHTWNAKYNRDAVWFGSINGGLAIRFKDANYRRPFVNAYYAWRPLVLPRSWAAGNGTISVRKNAQEASLRAEAANVPAGAEWNFELYLTPFHPLNLKQQLTRRYYHYGQHAKAADFATLRRQGATVVNLHHNTVWNPYINYPYNDDGGPFLKKIVKDAHDAGLLLKVYYTTRELTQNLPEFFALKSLDGEIFAKRNPAVPGWPCTNGSGPHPWLQQHVGLDIIPAWRENVRFSAYPSRLDLAVITTPETRWDNFFLAGLDRLVRNYDIDGIYIDDTALSGKAMQRARRILDRDGKVRLVDNHSWNHHSGLAGSGSSNLVFLDLYPYFDLLWRGEGFSNNTPADFWLVERSGLPFGVAGEMLGRGNPFRGLLFGMTDRWGWGGNPIGLWKFFDATKLNEGEFWGWWDDTNPITATGSAEVKASLWKTPTGTVLVLANFANAAQKVSLVADRAKLGFPLVDTAWTQPEISAAQKTGTVPNLAQPFEIPAGGGFIWVHPKN